MSTAAQFDIQAFRAERWPQTATPPVVDPLLARAQINYPDSEANQAAWLKAVLIVRGTSRGWRLDNPRRPEKLP